MKRNILLFSFVLFTISTLLIGNYHFNKKQDHLVNAAIKEMKADKEKEKKKEVKKSQEDEAKAVFDKHKGEKLVYSPMGDSISFGEGATSKQSRFTSLLSKMIEEKMGYDVELKEGVTIGGTGLIDGGLPNVQKVVKEKPNFVTIEFGTNDSIPEKTNAYSNPEDFKDNLIDLIDQIQSEISPRPEILLITTWNTGSRSDVYDEIIKDVSQEKNIQVADIKKVWKETDSTYGPDGYEDFSGKESDGSHPNDKGHKEIARKVYEKAYEVLK